MLKLFYILKWGVIMSRIEDVDKNLKVETKIEKEGLKFYNALSEPFKIYGVYMEDGKFRRLPESVAKNTSPGVLSLHARTAGGRIRFRTDSPYVAINVKMGEIYRSSHFTLAGSSGFDMYRNDGDGEDYVKTFMPPYGMEVGYESLISLDDDKMRDITINFPLYSEVKELYIGLDENARIEAPTPYVDKKPIVYYGSSITQGGCASRPGNSYQQIISRRFNCDYVNLGFSGSARAEDAIIEYVKSLDMSIFIYDYDWNAPNAQHLRNTHEKMFMAIREAHPETPIIIMPAPKWTLPNFMVERREVILKTYENAIARGDKNVYYIDGKELMALCKDDGTVDGVHPTDFGFHSMAKAVGDIIEKIWR